MKAYLRFGTTLSAALLAGLIGIAAPADAAEATGVLTAQEAQQVPLKRAASLIRWEVERGGHTGFAGIELADREVVLWWKGAPPAAVRRAVRQVESTAAVRVAAARHSRAELKAAAARIRGSLDVRPGQPVHTIKLAADGSGLRVSAESQASASRAEAAFADAGVPVELVTEAAPVPVSRADDWAPWSGGADNINPSAGSRCTSGFGVRNGANTRFILTAAHCGQPGNRINDGRGEFIGNVGPHHGTHDIALIQTSNVDDQIYVGGLDSNATRVVDGWDWVFTGELLCQSGGSSARDVGGPVCGLRVTKFNNDAGDAVEAEQVNGQQSVRPGDSGGPVYGNAASGGVIAKGINSYYYPSNNKVFGFQDFGTATRDFGVWIAK
nr:putative protease B [Kibdelosporangium sp. MJ126-NF4]